jgi:rhodanese-related sulfurtransferase
VTEVELLHVDDERVDVILTWDELASAGAETMPQHGVCQALNVDLLTRGALAQLPPANIEALLQRFEPISAAAGEVIIREGAPGDYYYVLLEGRAEVTRQVGGIRMRLAELKAGDAAGEEALLNDDPRNASVTMLTAGRWLRLAKADFTRLLRAPLLLEVDRAEAAARVAAGEARWLDVRFPAEFRQGHLSNAINIPLGEIRHADKALDPAQPLIVYCRTGRRSAAAAFLLAQRGFRTSCLRGGLQGQQANEDKESA